MTRNCKKGSWCALKEDCFFAHSDLRRRIKKGLPCIIYSFTLWFIIYGSKGETLLGISNIFLLPIIPNITVHHIEKTMCACKRYILGRPLVCFSPHTLSLCLPLSLSQFQIRDAFHLADICPAFSELLYYKVVSMTKKKEENKKRRKKSKLQPRV